MNELSIPMAWRKLPRTKFAVWLPIIYATGAKVRQVGTGVMIYGRGWSSITDMFPVRDRRFVRRIMRRRNSTFDTEAKP